MLNGSDAGYENQWVNYSMISQNSELYHEIVAEYHTYNGIPPSIEMYMIQNFGYGTLQNFANMSYAEQINILATFEDSRLIVSEQIEALISSQNMNHGDAELWGGLSANGGFYGTSGPSTGNVITFQSIDIDSIEFHSLSPELQELFHSYSIFEGTGGS